MLWGRKVPIQCVISLGTGIYRRPIRPTKAGEVTTSTSLREKLTKVVASATDTEGDAASILGTYSGIYVYHLM